MIAALGMTVAAALALAPATVQPPSGEAPPVAERPASPRAAEPAQARFASELAALSPADPRAYFELAESVMDWSDAPVDRDLARRLLVLAHETNRAAMNGDDDGRDDLGAAPGDATLDSSVCLALAWLAENDNDRRWLGAMAEALGAGQPGAAFEPIVQKAAREEAALELAGALGFVRAGEGRRATKILDKPAVSALLDKYERFLSPVGGGGGAPGGADRVRTLAARWDVCSECRNRKYVKGPEGVRLCPTCGGKPGPRLSEAELAAHLRLESVLLQGVQRSWTAQTLADDGAVLRDLDPSELARVYGVDPTRTVWSEERGGWVAPAAAEPPEEPAPNEAPPAAQEAREGA